MIDVKEVIYKMIAICNLKVALVRLAKKNIVVIVPGFTQLHI